MFCPRCDKDLAIKFFDAPKDGAWALYRCPFCDFVWRSTEKAHIQNKDLYEAGFKLDEEKISQMIEKPVIPPLREGEN